MFKNEQIYEKNASLATLFVFLALFIGVQKQKKTDQRSA